MQVVPIFRVQFLVGVGHIFLRRGEALCPVGPGTQPEMFDVAFGVDPRTRF